MLSREEWEAAKAKKAQPLSKEEWERNKRMAAFERQKTRGDFDQKYSAASDSGLENFLAGAGSGLTGVGRRAANLALPRALEPEWATEEAIKRQKATDEDLMATGSGQAGKLVGEIAATLPVGGAVGGLGRAAAATRIAPVARAGQALAAGSGLWARAATGALEGAGQAALMSEPDQLGKEAGIGAALGGGMGVIGKAVGATARALRPKISDDAAALIKANEDLIRKRLTDRGITDPKVIADAVKKGELFIPASQALPEGTIGRQINEGLMANLPGSGGVIRGQRRAAVDAVREELIESAIPRVSSGTTPTAAIYGSGEKMSDVIPQLQKAWDEAYDDIYKATVPGVQIPQEVAEQITARAGKSIKTGGDLSGREVLDLSQGIQQIINEMPKGRLERAARQNLEQTRKALESQLQSSLPADLADDFVKNRELYKNFLGLKDASKKAVGGEFSLRQAERSLAKKGGSARELAQQGTEVLKDFPSRQGIFQTIAASTVPLAGGGYVGWTTADQDASLGEKLARAGSFGAATLGGARALATPTAQKMLVQYGDQGVLDKYANALRRMGLAGRAGAVGAASQTQE
jgi:hypothetical protein